MIQLSDRKIVDKLIRLKLWKFKRVGIFQQPTLLPCWGTRWLFNRMLKRQTRDGFHHAPMCPGNEWSGAHLVTLRCNCGAVRIACEGRRRKQEARSPVRASPESPSVSQEEQS